MNKCFAALRFACGFLIFGTVLSLAEGRPEIAAQTAAEKWLTLVDAGKSDESWQAMSAPFKKEVSKRKWKSTIEEIRQPLGKRAARKLKSTEYTKHLAGAPEGEYVVVKFDSAFAGKPLAVETVTLVLGDDLVWRPSSYLVK